MPDLRIEQGSWKTRRGRRAWMGVLFALASCETATYSLEIRASGNGSTNPATGVVAWAPGTSVKVTAIPSLGSAFLGWSGAASGAQNPVSIVMDGNKALVAQFASIAVAQHWLKLEVIGEGTTDPGAGSHLYGYGEEVEVTATPAAGATFTGWSGAATGAANAVSVTMDGNKTLTASFSTGGAGHTLGISVSGDGTTNPQAGTRSYAAGSQIEVTARPAAGATFTGWSGAATGAANPVSVTMDGNKTLTANFSTGAAGYTPGTNVSGDGAASPPAGSHSNAAGSQSRVTATPADGAAAGTANPTMETMDGNKTLPANFSTGAAGYTLGINVSGDGAANPPAGTHSYAAGSQIRVTATPADGAAFTGWSGAATGTANPTMVTMDGNKTLTASFTTAAVHHNLGISVNGNGSTSPPAGTHSYAAGTQVQVAATPASGAVFAGWSGAATGTANPTTVTMDANKTVTATFSTGGTYRREVAIDKLTFNSDGSVQKVVPSKVVTF